MEANMLRQQLVTLLNSMFQEGFLDEQFTQLQMLQDASNPSFVADVISLFSKDSERLLVELTKTLEQDPIDFKKVDAYVHQFKGSSSRHYFENGLWKSMGMAKYIRTFCNTYILAGMIFLLSIGAHRVKVVCVDFRAYCEGRNQEGCRQALQLVKQEFYLVKSKLETMLQLEQKILAAGNSIAME